MKTNQSFNKIKIQSANRKRETFHAPFDVNTTFDFGDVQPLQCKLIVPNTKTVCSIGSVVRLAPMVAPTFTRMKYKTWTSFVAMSDLLRNFPNFLTKKAYPNMANTAGSFTTMQSLPRIPLSVLSSFVLCGSTVSCYFSNPDLQEGNYNVTSVRDYDINSVAGAAAIHAQTAKSAFRECFQTTSFSDWQLTSSTSAVHLSKIGVNGFSSSAGADLIPIRNIVSSSASSGVYLGYDSLFGASNFEKISLSEADYVFAHAFDSNVDDGVMVLAFKLSSFGKRLRKILLGCGYQISFQDATPVSVLPLFAFYKAYFDSFGLTLYQNWETTYARRFLNYVDNSSYTSITIDAIANLSSSSYKADFVRFIRDLGFCYLTESQDYISAHQETDAVGAKFSDGFLNNIVLSPNYDASFQLEKNLGQESSPIDVPFGYVPSTTNHVYINKVNHSEVDAKILQRLWKFTNRNTIAGQRIEQLLRAGGYGSFVDQQESSFIGYTELEINVDDVNCTADSFDSAGQNTAVLGDYVGKGIGASKEHKNLVYENKEFGYFITLAGISPESGFCQGVDANIYDLKPEDFYTGDFDGLGMEYDRKSIVMATRDWNFDSALNSHGAVSSDSFGVVPRFSRYKVTKNLMNGDFSLRGVRVGYLPYTLDKVIQATDRTVSSSIDLDNDAGKSYITVGQARLDQLPIAGNSWRYSARWPWLNSFSRIFTAFGNTSFSSIDSATALNFFELTYRNFDHFIAHNVINFTMYAPMLPISESYGTIDEDGKPDSSMIKA